MGRVVPLQLLDDRALAGCALPPGGAEYYLGSGLVYDLLESLHAVFTEELALAAREDGMEDTVDVEEDDLIVLVATVGGDVVARAEG